MDLLGEFLRHPDVIKQPRRDDGGALAWYPWTRQPQPGINVELCLRPSAPIHNHDPMEETLGRGAPGW